jgi:hypothetical protein
MKINILYRFKIYTHLVVDDKKIFGNYHIVTTKEENH